MHLVEQETIYLIGLSLGHQTTNANGQSAIDCGNLWQEFGRGGYASQIPAKISEEILAVYHDYAGDHTQPYSFFIGCKVQAGTATPQGLDSLTIPKDSYQKIAVKGKIPDAVGEAWQQIWKSAIPRAYRSDFEVYDDRSKDWKNAEVDIFLSVNP